MQIKKISLFKSVNLFMALFCLGTWACNYCGVNILTQNKAKSDFNGSSYEYQIQDDLFSIFKNDKLVGKLETDRKLEFQKNSLPNLSCNAAVIGAAGTVAAATGGAAVAAGTVGGAAVTAAGITGAAGAVAGGVAVVAVLAPPVALFVGAFALG